MLNCSSGSITETLLIYASVEGIFFSSASLTYSFQPPSSMLMLQLIVIDKKMYHDFLLQAINIEYSLLSCSYLECITLLICLCCPAVHQMPCGLSFALSEPLGSLLLNYHTDTFNPKPMAQPLIIDTMKNV